MRPGHSRETCPDKPISAQLTITDAKPNKLNAFCQVPMFATRCPDEEIFQILVFIKYLLAFFLSSPKGL